MAHLWHPVQWGQLQRLAMFTDQVSRLLYEGQSNGVLFKEIRALEDGLGLTEKGRRNLRWRLPDEEDPDAPVATVTELQSRQRPDPRQSAE